MISYDEIIEELEYMDTLSETDVPKIVNRMTKEQPNLLAYLMAAGKRDDLFDQYEAEIILFIGIVLWQVIKKNYRQFPKVKDKVLDQIEKKNEDFLEMLSSDSEGDFLSVVGEMVKTYPEPELLRYISEAIFEQDDPDDPPIREENTGLAFFYLKTVLDVILKVVNK